VTGHDGRGWSGWKALIYAQGHRNPAAGRAVVEWARLAADMQVLDIGCGPGAAVIASAPHLANGTVVGIDPSSSFVRIGRRRARHLLNATFDVGAAEQLPYKTNSFDVVWAVHSTHHWTNVGTGLSEAHRVLIPEGRIIIVERRAAARPWGISADQAQILAGALTDTGFRDVAIDERTIGRHLEYVITGRKAPR
jgi:ubiquinone/menaquinone biosynthesis C-methylase UbiE